MFKHQTLNTNPFSCHVIKFSETKKSFQKMKRMFQTFLALQKGLENVRKIQDIVRNTKQGSSPLVL